MVEPIKVSSANVASRIKAPRNEPIELNKENILQKLDVVNSIAKDSGPSNDLSSLSKIAKFRPIQLKILSDKIDKTISSARQSQKIRQAESKVVSDKAKSLKANSPLAQKSPLESLAGTKINLST